MLPGNEENFAESGWRNEEEPAWSRCCAGVVVFAELVDGGVVQRVHVCEEEQHLRLKTLERNSSISCSNSKLPLGDAGSSQSLRQQKIYLLHV